MTVVVDMQGSGSSRVMGYGCNMGGRSDAAECLDGHQAWVIGIVAKQKYTHHNHHCCRL